MSSAIDKMNGPVHYLVTIPGVEPFTSDDLTLREVALIEDVSGVPWGLAGPLTSVRVAAAYFLVAFLRSGHTEAEAKALADLDNLTQGRIKDAFALRFGNAPATAGAGDALPPS